METSRDITHPTPASPAPRHDPRGGCGADHRLGLRTDRSLRRCRYRGHGGHRGHAEDRTRHGLRHRGEARPQRHPGKAFIAFSILVGAVHAVRPIFPGREAVIAGFFGLGYGMAFSLVLADMHLSTAQLAFSLVAAEWLTDGRAVSSQDACRRCDAAGTAGKSTGAQCGRQERPRLGLECSLTSLCRWSFQP
ncbi:HupE/UreJ family protein [Streptomyces sp. NBC_00365]|uniref:HupE/UreJ family protein n=1 Tax=Streptomyces sp. NBC_00365 TaxID=2975726 RepID=UPI00338F6BDF